MKFRDEIGVLNHIREMSADTTIGRLNAMATVTPGLAFVLKALINRKVAQMGPMMPEMTYGHKWLIGLENDARMEGTIVHTNAITPAVTVIVKNATMLSVFLPMACLRMGG